jgi:predicted nuclease of predicted toxin-antitoxin system
MTTLYCDESVWIPVAKGLRHRGWEVKTATEEDRLGESDSEQLRFAFNKGYVLLTFDDDFLSLVEREDMDHSGIVYVNQTGRRIGEVVKQVDKLLQNSEDLTQIHYV